METKSKEDPSILTLGLKLVDLGRGAWEIGVSRERLLRMVQTGRIRGERIGGRWMAVLDDVLRLGQELAPAGDESLESPAGAAGTTTLRED